MTDKAKQRKALCYEALKRDILTLALRPGADLDEVRLTAQYSLSRTPLREVLRQLAGEGYCELRENRGARVAEMHHSTLHEFFIAAPMIYGAVLSLAACNAQPDQIEQLISAQASFKQALLSGSSTERALANNRFHEITGHMAHNKFLLPSFKRLLIDHARISMTFYADQTALQPQESDSPQAQADHHHDLIIQAIQDRNGTDAAQLATEHWNLSRDQIARFVMPTSLDLPLGAAIN